MGTSSCQPLKSSIKVIIFCYSKHPQFLFTVMSQQLLIVEMFIITLVTRVLYRRQYDPIPDLDDDVEETKTALTSKIAVDIA